MASSMLTGDRRWAPTRKSGMTVLGKVPKPINLPSQRLENHGLDPNVEIVPKGTLTWGSRPSSAAPNAWGTSNMSSPNTDGSASSPSHVSGRPSSAGSGTRPSTAGSDRSHEPVSNVWGPNSRPSSASGILASNHISASATRPRSAETRPGSSPLSRFAENSVDGTVVWGATGTAERLGVVSSKTSGFTLSSGDFPTLGSEKNSDSHMQRGHSSQGRPASASGTASTQKETSEPHLAENRNIDHSDHGNVNTWKEENHPYVGQGAPPNMGNWHKDPQQAPSYPNVNMPPCQFDSWHNPPFYPADGAWYGGGAAGYPYRPPGPPGSYPIDYPHVSARPLLNAQAVPRPKAGPGGFRPNNGEPFPPRMPPEPYMGPSHSDIPIRPAAYPGPVPYEGYYGPPHASFYNPSEREVPLMGMARPGVYNQYPTQRPNLDPGNFHARPGGYATVMTREQMKSNHVHETQGQYRVLLKQHDGWEDRDAQEKREHSVMTSSPQLESGSQPGVSRQEGDWRTKSQKQEPAVSASLSLGEAASSQPTGSREGHSSDNVVRNLSEDSSKAADDCLIKKPETANIRANDLQQYPVIKKNATLMEKVEGLNTKARSTDGLSEVVVFSSKERTKCFQDVTINADQISKVVRATAASTGNAPTSDMGTAVPNESNALTGDKNRESTSAGITLSGHSELQVHLVCQPNSLEAGENAQFQGQKRIHGVKGVDHCAKLRSSRHDNAEWMKKSPVSDSSVNTIVTSGMSGPGVCALECHASQVVPEKQELIHVANADDGSYTASSLDSTDNKAQRAKKKEIAIQRAKQLQEEEEERTREQKAKALAKLEELNRRTSAESSKKLNQAPPPSNDVLSKPESGADSAPKADATFIEAPSGSYEAVKQVDDDDIKNPGGATELSVNVASEASSSAIQGSAMPQDQSLSLGQETNATKITHRITKDVHHDTVSKQKPMGYRKRPSIPQEKTVCQKPPTSGSIGSPKYVGEVAVDASSSNSLPNNEDPSVQHRKKNNRSARNKNRPDEGLSSSTLPSSAQTEGNSEKCNTESGKAKPSASVVEAISVPAEGSNETMGTQGSRDVAVTSSNQGWSESTEETYGRVSNHWKPHPHRKSARNQQANKPVAKYHGTEAVIWAPVKPPNKNEPSEEVSQNSTTEATYPSSGKNGHEVQNGMKAKRAEMERYVPKPVAKELSQQGNIQQTSPSLSQAASGDMAAKPESGSPSVESCRLDGSTVGKAAFASDTRNEENTKHNRHGRAHASWRQRGSAESPSLSQSSLEVSLSSDPNKTVQKASDQHQPSYIDSFPKGQLTHTDDGWNDNNDHVLPSELVTSSAVAKNYGASRQRRQPYKVHRVAGNNYAAADNVDSQRGIADKSETESPAFGLNELDGRKAPRTECQNTGEHMRPHWQPKSQAYTHHGRQGNRDSGGGQRVPSQSGKSDKEYSSQGTENNPVQNEDNNDLRQRTVVAEPRDASHQESKSQRQVIANPSKEPTTVELAPSNVVPQHGESALLGVNQRGQYNSRFQRGHDTSYRGWDLGQDAGKQNFHMNGDKRKNSPHLEYQRIGPYNKPGDPNQQQKPIAGEEVQEGPRAPGSRYRERGRHHHPRGGGHFYGRSSGAAARVGDSYDSGE